MNERSAVDLTNIRIEGAMEFDRNMILIEYHLGDRRDDIRDINEYCLSSPGLSYKIHDEWNSKNETSLFGDACSPQVVGGSWDPTVACSSTSANGNCDTGAGCVPGSSSHSDDEGYLCDYEADPFSCEVGDLSGKLGVAPVAFDVVSTGWMEDPFLPSSSVIQGKSVVFYC